VPRGESFSLCLETLLLEDRAKDVVGSFNFRFREGVGLGKRSLLLAIVILNMCALPGDRTRERGARTRRSELFKSVVVEEFPDCLGCIESSDNPRQLGDAPKTCKLRKQAEESPTIICTICASRRYHRPPASTATTVLLVPAASANLSTISLVLLQFATHRITNE